MPYHRISHHIPYHPSTSQHQIHISIITHAPPPHYRVHNTPHMSSLTISQHTTIVYIINHSAPYDHISCHTTFHITQFHTPFHKINHILNRVPHHTIPHLASPHANLTTFHITLHSLPRSTAPHSTPHILHRSASITFYSTTSHTITLRIHTPNCTSHISVHIAQFRITSQHHILHHTICGITTSQTTGHAHYHILHHSVPHNTIHIV